MKQINYCLVCEGYAENYSLPNILNSIGIKRSIKFIRANNPKISQSSQPSKSKVMAKVSEFSAQSLEILKHDLFIVGVDLDVNDLTDEQTIFENQKKELQIKINNKLHNKSVVFIPVQSFDYWLLYQKHKLDKSKPHSNNSLESKSKKDIKKLLYTLENPRENVIKKTCEIISKEIDIQELSKQSKSFNIFIKSLTKALDNL